MEKKILTPDELKQFLLPAAIGFPLGGLMCAALNSFVIFVGVSAVLMVAGWYAFRDALKAEEVTKPNPINNNRQL